MKPRYSGEKSKKFWDRMNAVPGQNGKLLCSLGYDLQDIEGEVLKLLQEAEEGQTKRKVLKEKLKKAREVKRR